MEAILKLQEIVWGPYTIALLLGIGILYTVVLRFIQISKLSRALKITFLSAIGRDPDNPGDISHFQALMTALSATIGVGNIAGVATAIASGGPGAVFWMWMTGIFGMATKYAEALLAVRYRVRRRHGWAGGPMYYISRGLGLRTLASFFAIACVLASFGIGNMVQSNTMAESLKDAFGFSKSSVGIVVLILTGAVILGGIRSIAKITSLVVPFMVIIYILSSVAILVMNAGSILWALKLIFEGAFKPLSVAGGVLGYFVKDAIRYGIARGIFSNESGLGSSPIAAAAARTENPRTQALVSMTQTAIDTLFVNTFTALAIISTSAFLSGKTGAVLTSTAFSSALGEPGKLMVYISVSFFAFSTILGWSYYGERALEYLFGDWAVFPYRILWCAAVFVGAVMKLEAIWNISDVMNGFMAIPNLIALFALVGVVKRESQ